MSQIATTRWDTRRRTTAERNMKLVARYRHLYEVDRRRLDDVYNILEQEFFLSQIRIQTIIKTAL